MPARLMYQRRREAASAHDIAYDYTGIVQAEFAVVDDREVSVARCLVQGLHLEQADPGQFVLGPDLHEDVCIAARDRLARSQLQGERDHVLAPTPRTPW